jgi:hypothetical protein
VVTGARSESGASSSEGRIVSTGRRGATAVEEDGDE